MADLLCLVLLYFDICSSSFLAFVFFFFNDTATTEIYTLSLHDALPISWPSSRWPPTGTGSGGGRRDRKSTRLNSSHGYISYAVFCLKKKKNTTKESTLPKKTTIQHSRIRRPLGQ